MSRKRAVQGNARRGMRRIEGAAGSPAPRDPLHEGRDPFFSTLLGRPGEAVAEREHHEPDPVAHAELLEDAGEVRLHRALADGERVADLLVLVAGGHQAHDLELALGEAVFVAAAAGTAVGPEVRELLDQGVRHARVDPDLPGAHRVDRLHERLARRVLQDDALRAQLEGAHVLLLLVAGGEDQDLRARADAQDGRHSQAESRNAARWRESASSAARRGRAAHHVDFAGLRLYRSCMSEETSAPLVLTPRAVEMVKQVRAKEGFPE